MLNDLLLDLKNATNPKEIERIYRALEKVGVDRITANILIKEL